MEYLIKILEEEYNALDNVKFTKNGIQLSEHALNYGPKINSGKYTFMEMLKMHKHMEATIRHLRKNAGAKGAKFIDNIVGYALEDYDNRTIQIVKPDYKELISKLGQHKGIDFVASYKYCLFEPLNIKDWKAHRPKHEDRLLLYALDTENYKDNRSKAEENQKNAIRAAAHELGVFVADKPKKYMKWAHRTYKLNSKEGLHMRPASEVLNVAKKYDGEVWIRTERNEIIGQSIRCLIELEVTSDKELTILYKPKDESEQFYRDLESIRLIEGNTLLTRLK